MKIKISKNLIEDITEDFYNNKLLKQNEFNLFFDYYVNRNNIEIYDYDISPYFERLERSSYSDELVLSGHIHPYCLSQEEKMYEDYEQKVIDDLVSLSYYETNNGSRVEKDGDLMFIYETLRDRNFKPNKWVEIIVGTFLNSSKNKLRNSKYRIVKKHKNMLFVIRAFEVGFNTEKYPELRKDFDLSKVIIRKVPILQQ